MNTSGELESLSLFAGVGGFDLGFQNAGIKTTAFAEKDIYAHAIMKRHYPMAESFEDVKDVNRNTIRYVPDIVSGGFPCQDVSMAGNRAGLAGERSGLWFEYLRIVDELKPRWVVIENVPGLLSSNAGRDFATVIQGLVKCGYGVCWRVFDAQHFGVPQRRHRVFIVASFGNGTAAKVLFEPESCTGNPETRQTQKKDITTGTGNGLKSYRMMGFGHYSEDHVASPLKARDHKDSTDLIIQNNPDGKASVRRLTPVECERLQGFPDGWTSGQSDTQRYKQLGNAVCVPVAEWIGKRIVKVSKDDK